MGTDSTTPWASSPPLGAVYRLHGKVLLLGCGHDANQLATPGGMAAAIAAAGRHRLVGPPRRRTTGGITWVDVLTDEGDFERLGAAFEATGAVATGQVDAASACFMSQRAIVDFATAWMAAHRTA